MNITITSLAFVASFSTLSSLPVGSNQVVPAKANTFSKSEIVEIITANQLAIQDVNTFVINIPSVQVLNTTSSIALETASNNNDAESDNRKSVSADE